MKEMTAADHNNEANITIINEQHQPIKIKENTFRNRSNKNKS